MVDMKKSIVLEKFHLCPKNNGPISVHPALFRLIGELGCHRVELILVYCLFIGLSSVEAKRKKWGSKKKIYKN